MTKPDFEKEANLVDNNIEGIADLARRMYAQGQSDGIEMAAKCSVSVNMHDAPKCCKITIQMYKNLVSDAILELKEKI